MIICFDLETTGLDKYNDEIIEISMIKFDEKTFKILEKFSTLINPETKIPSIISNITNIFDEDVQDAPILDDIKKDILDFIWELPLLWHNTFFDRGFLIEKWINISDNIVVDTFFLANILCFNEISLNLEMLCKAFKMPFSWAHRAENDAKMTIKLFEKLKNKFKLLNKKKKSLLYCIFDISCDKNILFLKKYLFGDFKNEIDFEKFEKSILNIIWKYKNEDDFITNNELKTDASQIFKKLKKLETRKNQNKMLDLVSDTLKKSKKAVIEAPTWLWKSFAYLLPSVLHSVKMWEKVFISTKTKNLQDQLYFKDLEFLKNELSFDFRYTKLKGKKNYLNIKWFLNEFTIWDINYEKVCFLSKILLWLFETKYWELDEINYFWVEFSFLRSIRSEYLSFSKKDSFYRQYDFLYKARKKLENANIVVINHSLLFSDLKGENSVLWNMENLIIDEAHSIEDSVTDSLKNRFFLKNLEDIFTYIDIVCDKKKIKKQDFNNVKKELLFHLDVIFDYCFSYVNSRVNDNSNYKSVLLKQDFFWEIEFEAISKEIYLKFLSIIEFLTDIEKFDFSSEIISLESYLDLMRIILDKWNDGEYIKIISYNDKQGAILEYTLLNPWSYLKKHLRDNLHSVILTSATLKIWDSFDYFKRILYLDDFDFYSYPSDFDYKKQATLFIPNDLWSIKSNSKQVIDFLKVFYLIVRWKTLTLLTSFNMIRQIYKSVNIDLKKEWINIYAQSIWWSKSKLINSYFDDTANSILLWTDSFWEGVDMYWDDLKFLVIHKFPFCVPTDPIFQARGVFFNNSFTEYSIPKAIIKLKQWFWRLIRSKTDTWIVVLLDDRIFSTWWWRDFFNAFPSDINIKKWSSDNFFEVLKGVV